MPTDEQLKNGLLDWLAGSVSFVEEKPRSYWHATPATFTKFNLFQHFGDKEAADQRASHRSAQPHTHIEVWLQIRNPWMTFDDQGANNVAPLVHHALQKGVLDQDGYDRVLADMEQYVDAWANEPSESQQGKKWHCNMCAFAKELTAQGFDGLVYDNTVEGGLTYVPFRDDQIWWTSRDNPEA